MYHSYYWWIQFDWLRELASLLFARTNKKRPAMQGIKQLLNAFPVKCPIAINNISRFNFKFKMFSTFTTLCMYNILYNNTFINKLHHTNMSLYLLIFLCEWSFGSRKTVSTMKKTKNNVFFKRLKEKIRQYFKILINNDCQNIKTSNMHKLYTRHLYKSFLMVL